MNWNDEFPSVQVVVDKFPPNSGIGNHNYCRNPDGHSTIRCYTLAIGVRLEECEPATC